MSKKVTPQYMRIWGYALGLAVIVLLVGFGINQFLVSGQSTMQRAQAAFLQGDYQTALVEFNNVINDDPSNVEAYIGRGLTLLQMGQPLAAQNSFEAVIDIAPDSDDTRPYVQLTQISLAQGEFASALEYINTAIEAVEEPSASLLVHRGRVYLAMADYPSALSDFEAAQLADADYNEAYLYLGEVHFQLGNLSDALDAYEQYLANGGTVDEAIQSRINRLREGA